MGFLRVWLTGMVRPVWALDELRRQPAPAFGLRAVLIRWVGTSLTTTVLAVLLDREPFQPSYLTFLPTESYYKLQVFFQPVFGLAVWLLMSAVVHVVLRSAGKSSDFDLVLNIVGLAMLIPMPVVWLWDWTMMAANTFHLSTMSISHSLFQLWEASVMALAFKRLLGVGTFAAVALALLANVVFVLLAMTLMR